MEGGVETGKHDPDRAAIIMVRLFGFGRYGGRGAKSHAKDDKAAWAEGDLNYFRRNGCVRLCSSVRIQHTHYFDWTSYLSKRIGFRGSGEPMQTLRDEVSDMTEEKRMRHKEEHGLELATPTQGMGWDTGGFTSSSRHLHGSLNRIQSGSVGQLRHMFRSRLQTVAAGEPTAVDRLQPPEKWHDDFWHESFKHTATRVQNFVVGRLDGPQGYRTADRTCCGMKSTATDFWRIPPVLWVEHHSQTWLGIDGVSVSGTTNSTTQNDRHDYDPAENRMAGPEDSKEVVEGHMSEKALKTIRTLEDTTHVVIKVHVISYFLVTYRGSFSDQALEVMVADNVATRSRRSIGNSDAFGGNATVCNVRNTIQHFHLIEQPKDSHGDDTSEWTNVKWTGVDWHQHSVNTCLRGQLDTGAQQTTDSNLHFTKLVRTQMLNTSGGQVVNTKKYHEVSTNTEPNAAADRPYNLISTVAVDTASLVVIPVEKESPWVRHQLSQSTQLVAEAGEVRSDRETNPESLKWPNLASWEKHFITKDPANEWTVVLGHIRDISVEEGGRKPLIQEELFSMAFHWCHEKGHSWLDGKFGPCMFMGKAEPYLATYDEHGTYLSFPHAEFFESEAWMLESPEKHLSATAMGCCLFAHPYLEYWNTLRSWARDFHFSAEAYLSATKQSGTDNGERARAENDWGWTCWKAKENLLTNLKTASAFYGRRSLEMEGKGLNPHGVPDTNRNTSAFMDIQSELGHGGGVHKIISRCSWKTDFVEDFYFNDELERYDKRKEKGRECSGQKRIVA